MKYLRLIVAPLLALASSVASGQGNPGVRDTAALPRLEIPEITIVGRKAITLPFARKGEIYDVSLYPAPPPDTSLLRDRQSIALPEGALSRYVEHQMPWRASVEGSFGSYTTGGIKGYADYKTQEWGFYGNGGFQTTQGHTSNSSGSTTEVDVRAHSLVSTDNDVLRAMRVSGGLGVKHDSYGMFGLPGVPVERGRSNVSLAAEIGSVNRQGNVLDLSLDTKIWNITDSRTGVDSEVSVVSPDVRASFSSDLSDVRLGAELSYTGSSLNYARPTNSPSLLGFSAGARWKFAGQWFIHLGGLYQDGSGSDGSSAMLVAPTAILQWEASEDREWLFWLQPEIHLSTYDEQIRDNPYLVRELTLLPEKRPIRLGSSLSVRTENLTVRLNGSFTHSADRAVTLADTGRIRLGYIDADQLVVEASGTFNPSSGMRIKFSGTLQPGHETGTSVQLPMVPLFQASGRVEVDLTVPLTVWGSAEYWSRRNIDLAGAATLGDVVLAGCGVSTHAIPRTVFSFEIANLFNTAYEWWGGYIAPGRQLMLDAKINLQ